MEKLRVLDLFSGIGGFSLGLERTGGFETVAFCEIEPFPRRVLAKHWPGVPCYEDVRTLTAERLAADGITGVDVITGGFPCQDISTAGKQAGIGEGTRSGLWSEIVRLAGELRPQYIIVENVANLLRGPSERPGGWFGRILGDLAECGYDAEWENIPASALGAPHRRERVWLCAYPAEVGPQGRNVSVSSGESRSPRLFSEPAGMGNRSIGGIIADANRHNAQGQQPRGIDPKERPRQITGSPRPRFAGDGGVWSVEPDVGRVAHGVPDRAHRLAALGNSVVPQIPELIGRAILEARA
jgi:DNA (cytosine-5)-methyltransferase 1